MARLTDEALKALALSALEEAAASASAGPVKRTWALRLALAYLASRANGRPEFVRWPFDGFWRSLLSVDSIGRSQSLNSNLNGIYRAIGEKRDYERVRRFERLCCRGESEEG